MGVVLAGRTLVTGLTLHLVSGDRIGIIGPNGAGKTTLLKLVTGELAPTSGEVVRGTQTKIAYFDQARAGLIDDWSIYENVAEREGAERTGGGMVNLGDRALDLRTYLEQFLFEPSKQRQKVGSLSGGERARVGLAKMLKTGANLLLLDEPTNDLDIRTLGGARGDAARLAWVRARRHARPVLLEPRRDVRARVRAGRERGAALSRRLRRLPCDPRREGRGEGRARREGGRLAHAQGEPAAARRGQERSAGAAASDAGVEGGPRAAPAPA